MFALYQPNPSQSLPFPEAAFNVLRNLIGRLRGSVIEEGITLPNFSRIFDKTSDFPRTCESSELEMGCWVSPCTDTHVHRPFAAASRRREKTQTGCRECSSKDHSARLVLDFSHTCRLHKHRGCREATGEHTTWKPGSSLPPSWGRSTTWHFGDASH